MRKIIVKTTKVDNLWECESPLLICIQCTCMSIIHIYKHLCPYLSKMLEKISIMFQIKLNEFVFYSSLISIFNGPCLVKSLFLNKHII